MTDTHESYTPFPGAQTHNEGNTAPEYIHVSVAWPTPNGPFHVGHTTATILPADIFARFNRARGNRVLMVSGSDCHGSPVTLAAEKEGTTPEEVALKYTASFNRTIDKLGVSFDLFTTTLTPNHYRVTQDIFVRLLEHGYLEKRTQQGTYSETLNRFLPDRYVYGECPHCHFGRARGDQCENCGRTLDPAELINPRSTLDDKPVTFRDTQHYFLLLDKLEPALREWLDGVDHSYWRPNVLTVVDGWLREGLHARAITRDLDWGVPVPVDDPAFNDKRIYVWFDAVIGYLSASIEWAERRGTPDEWQHWWVCNADGSAPAKSFYFVGKDNKTFHAIMWPAMLIGYGDRVLPYDVPATEFMNLENEKISTSRNFAVWTEDVQSRYQPDQLRYYLTAAMPETKDSNWTWDDFVRRINDELVATYGNLVNRVLPQITKHFDGIVPDPSELTDLETTLLRDATATFQSVTDLLAKAEFRAPLKEAMALAGLANRYLDVTAPWKAIKTDRQAAARALWAAVQVINALKVVTYPFLPFSAEKVHGFLGFDGAYSGIETHDYVGAPAVWRLEGVPVGQKLGTYAPLFTKLDDSIIAEERARLGLA